MAVKQKVVECAERSADGQSIEKLNVMLRKLQEIETSMERIKICEMIVQELGQLFIPCSSSQMSAFFGNVQRVQQVLNAVCASSGPNKDSLIFTTLKALYSEISDPDKDPGPGMCLVLQLVDDRIISQSVNWILDPGHSEKSLRKALHTLCAWSMQWPHSSNLGNWVLAFMRGLEAQYQYDILVEVGLSVVEKGFQMLVLSVYRDALAPIVLHILSSMHQSPEALLKVLPHVPKVFPWLRKEGSESSLQVLQELTDLLSALLERFPCDDPSLEEALLELKTLSPSADYRAYLSGPGWLGGSALPAPLRSNQGRVGLNNLGNTCYMNSVLQALFMTRLFRNAVLQSRNQLPLVGKLQALFGLLQFSERSALSPVEVLHVFRPPGFLQGHQHDSSEFLGHLLDVLHEQEKLHKVAVEAGSGTTNTAAATTVVQKTFGGRAVTTYRCDVCCAESAKQDHFRELQLSFPSDFVEGQSVQNLLEYFLQPERLCDDNQYYCEKCNGLADAERIFQVMEPPARLILTLKHFQYDAASHQRTKLLHRVQYDSCVQLGTGIYDLHAAVVHCGPSLDCGHYYTYAKDDGWCKFNDSVVGDASAAELLELRPPATPYILFYHRRDCGEPGPLQRADLGPGLEAVLGRDADELAAERRKRPRFSPAPNRRRPPADDDDDHHHQPPGCSGGGGAAGGSFDQPRYIC